MSAAQADHWREQAVLLRGRQHMGEAEVAIAHARALAPRDPLIAFLHAQLAFERGRPAAALFAEVARLWPGNPDVVRSLALADLAEGRPAQAEERLAAALSDAPHWLEGHRTLAGLRFTAGDTERFDASFAIAARALPGRQDLWLGWFSAVAQVRDWSRARAVLDEAALHLGDTPQSVAARLFVAVESGDMAAAAPLIAATAQREGDFLALAHIRYHLRRGAPEIALARALALATGPRGGQGWPYVSTCWRLLGDKRAEWLDGPPYADTITVDLSPAELAELAQALRRLHTAHAPYAEQSVRGGTQTDRSVLMRHEPIFERTRVALLDAVATCVRRLPPGDRPHPVLGRSRDDVRIAGSWSVRLGPGGHNVTHSHPLGWLSGVFYVAVPDEATMGPPPAGYLQVGAPPAELGVDLPPYRRFAPRPGELVLFPSTLWHGTVPTQGGERLNIAFDIVPA